MMKTSSYLKIKSRETAAGAGIATRNDDGAGDAAEGLGWGIEASALGHAAVGRYVRTWERRIDKTETGRDIGDECRSSCLL
jgi:hypothetical protein